MDYSFLRREWEFFSWHELVIDHFLAGRILYLWLGVLPSSLGQSPSKSWLLDERGFIGELYWLVSLLPCWTWPTICAPCCPHFWSSASPICWSYLYSSYDACSLCCVGDREASCWSISLLVEYCIAGERIIELEGLPQHFIKQQHHNHLLAPSLGNSWGQIGVFSLGCVWHGGCFPL
jgi:hypothetical protein